MQQAAGQRSATASSSCPPRASVANAQHDCFARCLPHAGWLEAASVAASLEDARLAALTALKALLTTAHKQWSAGAGGEGGASAATAAGGGITTAAVQAALAVVGDALGDLAACAKERAGNAVQAAAAEAAAVDPVGAHLSNLAESAYCLLLLVQRWGGSATPPTSAAEEDAAAGLCAGLLQATG